MLYRDRFCLFFFLKCIDGVVNQYIRKHCMKQE